ncbi:DUF6126 family protein [Streptomyces sp. NBC_00669]|jgi:Family of unknown function (DUF6126)|uniref:DUF6126 family protein n=1 Tax=unclassified Streptomyces TaxID=2593676 RepID=UPI002E32A465|nr:DUF6126 family protein [Streptomyces sp. NBC_00669]
MTTNPAEPRAHPAPEPTAEPAPTPRPGPGPAGPEAESVPVVVVVPALDSTEKHKERAVILRVLVYVAVAHFMAFFLWLMFAVIGKS